MSPGWVVPLTWNVLPPRATCSSSPPRAPTARTARSAAGCSSGCPALLDGAALLDLLDRQALRGAALDVFATEPLAPDDPLWAHPRVLVSPHVSPVTDHFWEREASLILDNLRRYLAGSPLRNVVDLDAGY